VNKCFALTFFYFQVIREEAESRLKRAEDELSAKEETFQSSLNESRRNEEEAAAEVEELSSKVDALEGDLQQVHDYSKTLESKNEELTVQLTTTQTTVDELNSTLEAAQADLSEKDQTIVDLMQEIEGFQLGQESFVTESVQRSGDSEAQKLKEMADHNQSELKKRERLVSELVSDCKRLKNELASLTSENASLHEEKTKVASQVQSLLALRTQYEMNENHLKSELAEKDRLIHRQQLEVEESRQDQQTLVQSFGVTQASEASQMLATYLDEIRRLKLEIRDKNEAADHMRAEKSELEVKISALVDNVERLKEDIEGLNQLINDKEAEINELHNQRRTYEENLSILEEELAESRKRWEEEKTRFIMDSEELELKFRDSEEKMRKYENQLSEVQDDNRNLSAELEQRSDSISHLEQLNSQLEPRLKEKDDMLSRLTQKIHSLASDMMQDPSQLVASDSTVVHEEHLRSSDGADDLQEELDKLHQVIRAKLGAPRAEDTERMRIMQEQLDAGDARMLEQSAQVGVQLCGGWPTVLPLFCHNLS